MPSIGNVSFTSGLERKVAAKNQIFASVAGSFSALIHFTSICLIFLI